MEKKLCELNAGGRFTFAGLEWVKLAENDTGILCLTADITECRAFKNEGKKGVWENGANNWRNSDLRVYLNGEFFDKLSTASDSEAFIPFEQDLTSDDGMDNYGTDTARVQMITCSQYRKHRELIPQIDSWFWTLTPWSCNSSYSYYVHYVYMTGTGTIISYLAYNGIRGVRPLCNLKSDILVSPYENDKKAELQDKKITMKTSKTRRKLTKGERHRIYNKTNERCAYCGCELQYEDMEVDHVVPLARGGDDKESNMLPSCRSCNHYKSNLTIEKFRAAVERFPIVLTRDSITFQNALRFGLVKVEAHPITFYFEQIAEKTSKTKHVSLHPCPKCGSAQTELHDDEHYYWEQCSACEFKTSAIHHKVLAIKNWNQYPENEEEII